MGEDGLTPALLEMLRALVARAPLFAEHRARGHADDLVQDALLAVTRRMARGDVADPFAYATRVVQNLARRALVEPGREEPCADVGAVVRRSAPAAADVAAQREELAEVLDMVRAVTGVVRALPPGDLEMLRAELAREDQAALARRLGLARATFYRRKRAIACRFVDAVAASAGAAPCADRREGLLAAAGGSGFASAVRAREHAGGCEGCATTLRHLAAARHGLALLAPLPALTADGAGWGERWSAAGHTLGDWLRGAAVRTPDPAALVPASRGAGAVVAALCVGVGGAGVCASGVLPAPAGHDRPVRSAHRASPEKSVPSPRPAAAPSTATPSVIAHRPSAGRAPLPTLAAPREFGTRPPGEFAPHHAAAAPHEFQRSARRRRTMARRAEFASRAAASAARARTGREVAPAAAPAPAPIRAPSASREFGGSGGRGADGGGEFGG